MVKCYLCPEEANKNCSNCDRPICNTHATTVKSHSVCRKCAKFHKWSIIENILTGLQGVIIISCIIVPVILLIVLLALGIISLP
ncbi:MAG: hypothetical protein ACFFAN_10415 [Promethearchaeota archaeon]